LGKPSLRRRSAPCTGSVAPSVAGTTPWSARANSPDDRPAASARTGIGEYRGFRDNPVFQAEPAVAADGSDAFRAADLSTPFGLLSVSFRHGCMNPHG